MNRIDCQVKTCTRRFYTTNTDCSYYKCIPNGHSIRMEVGYYYHLIHRHQWEWCGLCNHPVSDIKQHNIDSHDDIRPYVCLAPICCANFETILKRNDHLIKNHRWIPCTKCDPVVLPFPHDRRLLAHVKKRHP
jgi:hypothetical protein